MRNVGTINCCALESGTRDFWPPHGPPRGDQGYPRIASMSPLSSLSTYKITTLLSSQNHGGGQKLTSLSYTSLPTSSLTTSSYPYSFPTYSSPTSSPTLFSITSPPPSHPSTRHSPSSLIPSLLHASPPLHLQQHYQMYPRSSSSFLVRL